MVEFDLESQPTDDIYSLLTLTATVTDIQRDTRPKIEGFVERVVLTKVQHGGYAPISVEKQFLVFLWYVAYQDSQREIAMIFGIGEWAVNNIIRNVSDVLCQHRHEYISWPNDLDRENDISDSFYDLCGIPNVCGALDGAHIAIVNCPQGESDYINRKGFHLFSYS